MEKIKAIFILVLGFMQLLCFVSCCKPYNDTSEHRLVAMFEEKGYTLEEVINELKLMNKTSSIR